MESSPKIVAADLAALSLVKYPDPRLREKCTPIEDAAAEEVRTLAERMLEIMFESRGVGLAAPQAGVTVRLFVASPTFQREDVRVYVNPQIVSVDGRQDGEEGCLSFPGVNCKVRRYNVATVRATDLQGRQFEETGEGLTARIFQHEIEHLNGQLLVDRMSSVAKLANRKLLKQLEESFPGAG